MVYDPQYWSLVFPLGMYTVATFTLEQETGLRPLTHLPQIVVWPARVAWLLAFLGTLRALARVVSRGDE